MELHAQIKKYRGALGLSQEELAEKVYVTRQTVSNWENEKSYPDIHSLLLLSNLFQLSLDQLIKGDLETMKELVNEYDLREYKRCTWIFAGHFFAMVILCPLLVLLINSWYKWIPFGLLVSVTLFWSFKIERLNKCHDIQTYREISAFMDGKKLDQLQKAAERGKRPYQRFASALVGAVVGFFITAALAFLLRSLHLIP